MQQALATKICLLALFCIGLPHYSVAAKGYCIKSASVEKEAGIKLSDISTGCDLSATVSAEQPMEDVKAYLSITANGMESKQETACGDDCMKSLGGICKSVDPPSSQDGDVSLASDVYQISGCSGDILNSYAPNPVKVLLTLKEKGEPVLEVSLNLEYEDKN